MTPTLQIADRRGVGVWRRHTVYEAVQRYTLRLLDAIRNSTIFLVSRLTVHSARDAFDKTRHVLNRVFSTGRVVATEHVPRATQAIVDAGHRNQVHCVLQCLLNLKFPQDTIVWIGQMAGRSVYLVGMILYKITSGTLRFVAAVFRAMRGRRSDKV